MSSPTDATPSREYDSEAPEAQDLRIGGFVPLSTVDWPGQLVATVFTRGCPWDCPYCHNPHLLSAVETQSDAPDAPAIVDRGGFPTWPELLAFLETRAGLLDGVVFTGGEPLLQAGLAAAMYDVRRLGFSVALHTGGALPGRFREVLPLIDWVGFDVKAPFGEYERVTRVPGSGESALESLRALVASGVAFEARTTVHPDLLTEEDLEVMADELVAEGVRHWALQTYRSDGVRPGLPDSPARDHTGSGTPFAHRFEGFTVR